MATNSENYKAYLKKFDRTNIPITKKQESYADLIKEGNRLLEEEEKLQKIEPVKPSIPSKSIGNPYANAREELLSIWRKNQNLAWKAKEIEDMESGKIPKNHYYDEFAKAIIEIGDKY